MRGMISPEPDPMPNGGIAVWNKVIEFIEKLHKIYKRPM